MYNWELHILTLITTDIQTQNTHKKAFINIKAARARSSLAPLKKKKKNTTARHSEAQTATYFNLSVATRDPSEKALLIRKAHKTAAKKPKNDTHARHINRQPPPCELYLIYSIQRKSVAAA